MRSVHGVDPDRAQRGEDRREPLLPHLGAELAGVEPHVLGPGLAHAAHDRLRDDVARGEVGERVLALHERDAGVVEQHRALAAHRLGDQRLLPLRERPEPHHRGVELHELEVGHRGTCAQRERDAVAGGDVGVGGLAEDLAEAARGEDHGRGEHRADAVALARAHHVQREALRRAAVVDEQVEGEGVLDHLDPRPSRHGRDEGARDLGARWRRRRRARCGRAGGRPRG